MRDILTQEQAKQVVSEIEAWRQRHIANLERKPDDQRHWQQAKLLEFEQLTGIDQVECYLVTLRFGEGIGSYKMSIVLGRDTMGLHELGGFTFYAPDFTHPAQNM